MDGINTGKRHSTNVAALLDAIIVGCYVVRNIQKIL